MPTIPKTVPSRVQTSLRNISSKATAIPSVDVVTIPSGIAGALVNFSLHYKGIVDLSGGDIGSGANSSITITSGTVFTTLVAPKADADLANGEYYVDHFSGKARGRKADSGTTISFQYDIFVVQTSAQFSGDVEIGAVEIKDGSSDNRVEVDTSNRLHVFEEPNVADPVSAEVAVTSSATALLASADPARKGVLIVNGAAPITLGPAAVTFGTTPVLQANQSVILDNYGGKLYGITSSGTSTVRVFTW